MDRRKGEWGSQGGETIVKAMGGKVSGGKATGVQVSQATGGKSDRLSEREPDNSLPPSDKAVGQNVMEGVHRKSYSDRGGEKESEGICGGLNS